MVEPPASASSTRTAFSKALGRHDPPRAPVRADQLTHGDAPVSSASARSRSASTARMAAAPAGIMPSASARLAMVLADAHHGAGARCRGQGAAPPRRSVRRLTSPPAHGSAARSAGSPACRRAEPLAAVALVDIGLGDRRGSPAGLAKTAPPSGWAGTVCAGRRAPPPRPSAGRGPSPPPHPWPSGCGTSGWSASRKTSPSEMVGNSTGRAPAASTPRFTASISSGKWRGNCAETAGGMADAEHCERDQGRDGDVDREDRLHPAMTRGGAGGRPAALIAAWSCQ